MAVACYLFLHIAAGTAVTALQSELSTKPQSRKPRTEDGCLAPYFVQVTRCGSRRYVSCPRIDGECGHEAKLAGRAWPVRQGCRNAIARCGRDGEGGTYDDCTVLSFASDWRSCVHRPTVISYGRRRYDCPRGRTARPLDTVEAGCRARLVSSVIIISNRCHTAFALRPHPRVSAESSDATEQPSRTRLRRRNGKFGSRILESGT